MVQTKRVVAVPNKLLAGVGVKFAIDDIDKKSCSVFQEVQLIVFYGLRDLIELVLQISVQPLQNKKIRSLYQLSTGYTRRATTRKVRNSKNHGVMKQLYRKQSCLLTAFCGGWSQFTKTV